MQHESNVAAHQTKQSEQHTSTPLSATPWIFSLYKILTEVKLSDWLKVLFIISKLWGMSWWHISWDMEVRRLHIALSVQVRLPHLSKSPNRWTLSRLPTVTHSSRRKQSLNVTNQLIGYMGRDTDWLHGERDWLVTNRLFFFILVWWRKLKLGKESKGQKDTKPWSYGGENNCASQGQCYLIEPKIS